MTPTQESLQEFVNKLNKFSPVTSSDGRILPAIIVEGSTDIQYFKTLLCEDVVFGSAGDKQETLRRGKEIQGLVSNRPVFTIVDADFERLDSSTSNNPPFVARCDHHDVETMFYSCGYADVQYERLRLNTHSKRTRDQICNLVQEAGWALLGSLRLGDTFGFDDVCFDAACRFLNGNVLDPIEALYRHLQVNGSTWHTDKQVERLRLQVGTAKRKLKRLGVAQPGYDWDLVVGHHVQDAIAAMGVCLPSPAPTDGSASCTNQVRNARDVSHHLRDLITDDVDNSRTDGARLSALRKLHLIEQLGAWEMNGKYRLLKCGLVDAREGRARGCRGCARRSI